MPAIPPPPPPFHLSPEVQRRRKQILYWSYRRARPIWLISFGLGVLLLIVGRSELDPAMGFALLLVGGILALTGLAGFVAFEAVMWPARGGFSFPLGPGAASGATV